MLKLKFSQPEFYALAIAVLFTAMNITLILSNLTKGFDWTDEAFIVSLTEKNQVTNGEAWGFQHLLQPIWQISGETIVGARVTRFIGTQLSVLFATIAVTKWAKAVGSPKVKYLVPFIALTAECLALLSWVYWPRVSGYNELSSLLSTAGTALLISMVSNYLMDKTKSRIWSWIAPISLGFIASLLILTKITTGVIFVVFALVGVIITSQSRWSAIAQLAGGSLGTLALVAMFGYPLRNYAESVFKMLTDKGYAASFAHPPQLLQMSLADLNSTLITLSPYIVGLLVSVYLVFFSRSEIETNKNPNLYFGVAIFFFVFCLMINWVSNQPYLENKSAALGLVVGTIAIVLLVPYSFSNLINNSQLEKTPKHVQKTLSIVFVAVLAICTPLMSSFGTNGTITVHSTFNESIWGAFLGLGLILFINKLEGSFILKLVIALVIPVLAYSGFRFSIADSQKPYRSSAYAMQESQVNHSRKIFTGLSVDSQSADQLNWLTKMGSKYSDTPVIAIASPGALLAFNNKSFASPFIEDFWPGSFGTISKKCETDNTPKDLVIILPSFVVPGNSNYELLTQALASKCKLSLNNDFKEIATSPPNESGISFVIFELAK